MNSIGLRKYFISRYQSTFYSQHNNDKFAIEISFLKKLLDKYSEFLILEAIDQFIGSMPQSKANILYFASPKVFPNKFKHLITLKDVIKYQRLLPLYCKEDQSKIRRLINEYSNYIEVISLNPEDIERKKEIVSLLQNLTPEEELLNAERTGTESALTTS